MLKDVFALLFWADALLLCISILRINYNQISRSGKYVFLSISLSSVGMVSVTQPEKNQIFHNICAFLSHKHWSTQKKKKKFIGSGQTQEFNWTILWH